MKKRILIVTNHSYMFWQFRKELVEALQKEHEVILAMPFVGHEEDFRKMGFEFESFGGKDMALRGVPSDLYGFTGKEMILELLDGLSGEADRIRTDAIGDKIATMACKAAVKGNMRISPKEADALIEELLKAENPYTCPHGRPTIISMTKTELEKKFKRIV